MSIVRSSWPCFFVCFRGEPRLRTRRGFRLCGGEAAGFPIAPATPSAAHLLIDLYRSPTLAGRGGSVSRRDHNQANRRYAQLTGGTTYAEVPKPNAATLRERGSGGEALLLEKRPLPQRSPHHVSWGGSAREGASLQRSPLPRIFYSLRFYWISTPLTTKVSSPAMKAGVIFSPALALVLAMSLTKQLFSSRI